MSDLIERQAAIDGIIKSCFGVSNVVIAEAAAIQYIKKIPSVHGGVIGEWICISIVPGVWTDVYECSKCKKEILSCSVDLPNYCPKCGADMRGKHK